MLNKAFGYSFLSSLKITIKIHLQATTVD